jgi:hypothetical protein
MLTVLLPAAGALLGIMVGALVTYRVFLMETYVTAASLRRYGKGNVTVKTSLVG